MTSSDRCRRDICFESRLQEMEEEEKYEEDCKALEGVLSGGQTGGIARYYEHGVPATAMMGFWGCRSLSSRNLRLSR